MDKNPNAAERKLARGIYRHFKGLFYLVLGEVTHSETGERMVAYQHLHGDYGVCVRPVGMFLSEIETDKHPDAGQPYRFIECEPGSIPGHVTDGTDRPVQPAADLQRLVPRGVYRHYKGKLSMVLTVAQDSETLEPMVIYKTLETGKLMARPYSLFFDAVDRTKHPEAVQDRRFEPWAFD